MDTPTNQQAERPTSTDPSINPSDNVLQPPQAPVQDAIQGTELISGASPYAVGYHQALALRLKGREAKFFAQAFAGEYEVALTNRMGAQEAIAYATDFAGPYALAVMAFLKENAAIIPSAKLVPDAQNYAYANLAAYEEQFRSYHETILQDEAAKEQLKQEKALAKEKKRLEEKAAIEERIAQERKQAQDDGYREGFADGMKKGKQEGHKQGLLDGHEIGKQEGLKEGYQEAITKDYDDGLVLGKKLAYKTSSLIGIPIITILGATLYFLL